MKKKSVIVKSQSGLHARPASALVACAQQFESDINLEKEGNSINAKSIIGILGLGVNCEDEIIITADGADEIEAVETLSKLVQEELVHL